MSIGSTSRAQRLQRAQVELICGAGEGTGISVVNSGTQQRVTKKWAPVIN